MKKSHEDKIMKIYINLPIRETKLSNVLNIEAFNSLSTEDYYCAVEQFIAQHLFPKDVK